MPEVFCPRCLSLKDEAIRVGWEDLANRYSRACEELTAEVEQLRRERTHCYVVIDNDEGEPYLFAKPEDADRYAMVLRSLGRSVHTSEEPIAGPEGTDLLLASLAADQAEGL